MTRRDTIIAAVLVNSGLLIVLFASALKSGDSDQASHLSGTAPAEPAQEMPAVVQQAAPAQVDEVDQVLKQYASASQPAATLPLVTAPVETSMAPSFTDDLRAIALPEVSAQMTPQVASSEHPNLLASPQPQASAVIDYKVKKGDVLEKIARHHHCKVDEIMKLNKLTSANLRIGQMLKIPSKVASTATAAPASTVSATQEGSAKYYTVKNGDNPWTIAVKNHMKVEDLLKLNNLDQEKARKLKPGDRLRIN